MSTQKKITMKKSKVKIILIGAVFAVLAGGFFLKAFHTSSEILEGTVIYKTNEKVYLDNSDDPIPYAASVQQPGHNDIQIVALTEREYEKIEIKDQIMFYDDDGIYRFRSIKK